MARTVRIIAVNRTCHWIWGRDSLDDQVKAARENLGVVILLVPPARQGAVHPQFVWRRQVVEDRQQVVAGSPYEEPFRID